MESRKRFRIDYDEPGPSGQKRPRLYDSESSESGGCLEESASDSTVDSIYDSDNSHNSETGDSDSNDSQPLVDDSFEVEEVLYSATSVRTLESTVSIYPYSGVISRLSVACSRVRQYSAGDLTPIPCSYTQ